MPDKILPRIATVEAVRGKPFVLQVAWRHGGTSQLDIANIVATFRVFALLRNDPALFASVRVGEHGTDVVWTDDIDLAADTLWHLAQEQSVAPATAPAL